MTVKELKKELMEKGYYLAMVPLEMFPIERQACNTAYKLIHAGAGVNWRLLEVTNPDPEKEYTITLTGEELGYAIDACDIYGRILYEIHAEEIKKELRKVITALGKEED